MEPITQQMRERILAACDAGHGPREVARWFGLGESTVGLFKRRRRQTGETAPRKSGPKVGSGKWDDAARQRLAELVAEHPDATEPRLVELVSEHIGIDCSRRTVGRQLAVLGITFKK